MLHSANDFAPDCYVEHVYWICLKEKIVAFLFAYSLCILMIAAQIIPSTYMKCQNAFYYANGSTAYICKMRCKLLMILRRRFCRRLAQGIVATLVWTFVSFLFVVSFLKYRCHMCLWHPCFYEFTQMPEYWKFHSTCMCSLSGPNVPKCGVWKNFETIYSLYLFF